jgi:hypothetical protein
MVRFYLKIFAIIMIHFGLGSSLKAQNEQTKLPSIFTLGWDNDFAFQTDYYFTNGMSLQLQNNALQRSPLNLLLLPNSKNQTVLHRLSIRHDMFTPRNTRSYSPQIGDRPYASYWLIGQTKSSFNHNKTLVISSGIYFGMSGQQGGGEWVQNGIHDILPSSGHVNGWSNQIGGSFLLDYKIAMEKQIYRNRNIRISASANGMFGAPYTNIAGGMQLYFGQIGEYPDPSFTITQKDFQIYGYAKVESKWVIYNETLQGSILNGEPSKLYIDPNPLVAQIKIGVNMRYKRFSMEMGENFISPEFGGAVAHKWGYVRFYYSF